MIPPSCSEEISSRWTSSLGLLRFLAKLWEWRLIGISHVQIGLIYTYISWNGSFGKAKSGPKKGTYLSFQEPHWTSTLTFWTYISFSMPKTPRNLRTGVPQDPHLYARQSVVTIYVLLSTLWFFIIVWGGSNKIKGGGGAGGPIHDYLWSGKGQLT